MIKYRAPANRSSRRSRVSRSPFSKHHLDVILLSKLTKFAFFGLIAAIVLFFGYFLWISRSLPTPGKLAAGSSHDSTKILDKNGTILYSIYKDYNRIYVPLNDIPNFLQEATISTEDKNFYTNSGFSITGYLRSAVGFVIHHQISGGGSTITQQLVKNVLLSPEQNITRKVKELILAIEVDKKYSKQQILEMYLNNIPYGGTAVGIEAAANQYFGVHAKDLTQAECAFLAGLPQAPSYYSPYSGNDAYIDRTAHVLDRMVADGKISQNESKKLLAQVKQFKFQQDDQGLKAPHFVMEVRNQLNQMFGESAVINGDLTVKTTLDEHIQQIAEQSVKTELDKLKGYHVTNGAAIVMDPKTDAVLAMVGSKDYFDKDNDGNFNAALAHRQPGSSLKPVIYATAFEKGYTPATLLMDVKTDFPTGDPNDPTYTPVNYDGKYHGPVQIRFALANSFNVPAVKMLAMIGIKNAMQKAYDMGIENWKPTQANINSVGLSLVLGGREVTLLNEVSAYSVFADQGVRHDPFYITEVDDAHGKVIYKHQPEQGTQVLSKEVTFLISHILSDNVARSAEFGSHSALVVPGKTVSVKTGTTDEKRDNWTVGYTPSYVVGVWVGNNDNSPMNQAIASGITGAAPIWNDIMSGILKGKPDQPLVVPSDVKAMQIDALGGGLPVDGQPTRAEYFIDGTQPTAPSPIYKQIKVQKGDNSKPATDDQIAHGDYEVKQFIVFQENDPVSTDGVNRWQQGIDAWVTQTYPNDPMYHPPTTDQKQGIQPVEDTPTPTLSVSPTQTPAPTP